MVKLDAAPEGGIEFDNKFFMQPDDYLYSCLRCGPLPKSVTAGFARDLRVFATSCR